MTNNLTTRLLLAVVLVGTLAVPAQAASNLYKFARSTYLFSFYDHVCKPGSLSPNAKKLVELVTDNLPPDLKSRAINEIAETGKRYGPAYCTQLEHEIDVNGFNASAELPGVMQSAKANLDKFIAEAKLADAEQAKPYFSAQPPGGGSSRFILRDSNVAPDWRTMTIDECIVTIDTELAKRDQELSRYEMFRACDLLTKGFAARTITRPRQGTEAGGRVSECMRRYYARTPYRTSSLRSSWSWRAKDQPTMCGIEFRAAGISGGACHAALPPDRVPNANDGTSDAPSNNDRGPPAALAVVPDDRAATRLPDRPT